ncbi:hypothetical protein AQUCO_00900884v1 [Aquilegia coerulea]|uniref:DNA-directed RNA polymerase subunit n=1 Tax=Aquilegia coerulea TaxID=218851 RepID=A0A2G5EFT6_AQUCA|nr:hypothetical protein AQUCO_00900884v1 [Aquilegia coerulea]PIA54623.1 hypothetical protein AQUCO_00900884v1 [Aquilegia coerulea]
MDSDMCIELEVPSARLARLKFSVLTERDLEKMSVLSVDVAADVTNAKLGLPNEASECSTCGATDTKNCDGHYGIIKLPMDFCHPYFVRETVNILNNFCPGCKSIKTKGSKTTPKTPTSPNLQPTSCNYCAGHQGKGYPKMKFKVASKNLVGKMASVVSVEVADKKLPKKFQDKMFNEMISADYWSFIKADPSQKEMGSNSFMKSRNLSPFQVYSLLKDLDPETINKMVVWRESLFLTCLPVTPNGNRVIETADKMFFDKRTTAYKKLFDFKANEFGSRVHDCLSVSKLHTEKSTNTDIKSGVKLMKDVILSKRTDHSFRMVVVGDPNINFGEIGLPWDICQAMVIAETLDILNQERLQAFCKLSLLEKGEFRVRRKGNLVSFRNVTALEIGDIVYRNLDEGDLVLVNRPPSIHQHSLFALSVRVLPMDSVTSLNPVCCSPLRGDFDGDCLHGYIPQSINVRVELRELVDIHTQLVNGQNGRSLLSLCHDSLTAVYLLREKGVFLNKIEMQQLGMSCRREILIQKCYLSTDLTASPCKVAPREWSSTPAILKASSHLHNSVWTGNQLLSMLFPQCFDYVSPSNGIHICKGEIMYSTLESSWLQDTDNNIFSSLVKHYGSEALDILCCAQEVLLEWISTRGFSVSLTDLYICSDAHSRTKMLEEVNYGLHEAEQRLHTEQLMVDLAKEDFLRQIKDNQNFEGLKDGNTCHFKDMAVLNRLSVSAFKEVFRDLQSLIFRYSIKDNSLLAMVKAGSKGSLLKLIEQGVTLGLQHSTVPLSFSIPRKISSKSGFEATDVQQYSANNVPYAVVESSFLEGLNPGDCFMHSMASRSTSFGDNASVPGTLFKNLMSYMRDLYLAYDGTVRNLNGDQVIQFTYDVSQDSSVQYNCGHEFKNTYDVNYLGSPVGSLAACSIAEAAYSVLDQPNRTLESSPLLNLKKLLESSSQKKSTVDQTVSLFLSKKLERWLYGFEYGASKVKSHLERVLFSDVVSTVMINFAQQEICEASKERNFSSRVPKVLPVVECVFHLCKKEMKKRGLNADSVIDVLNQECDCVGSKHKVNLPKLHIFVRSCSIADAHKEHDEALCIIVISELSNRHPNLLNTFRDLVIPLLLGTIVGGCSEIQKVDILWNDGSGSSKAEVSTGELYLKVHFSETCKTGESWNLLVDKCLPIMDIIDWEKSHPDSIPDIHCAYGIDGARDHFLSKLKVIVSQIGKSILLEHLVLIADCLSLTGEFVGLNAKGIARQRNLASVSSPFTQACFSNSEACFIKAAKKGLEDSLLGALDAAAWGKEIPIGTGGKFDILYSGKVPEVPKPTDIYSILSCHLPPKGKDVEIKVPTAHKYMSPKISRTTIENTIERMSTILRDILHKRYSIDDSVSEEDKVLLMQVLHFHPKSTEKMGTGIQDIKVGRHPEHPKTRCFLIIRNDGSVEDFSYIKCVEGARKALDYGFHQM